MCLELSSESDCSKLEIQNNAADVQLICDIKALTIYISIHPRHMKVFRER